MEEKILIKQSIVGKLPYGSLSKIAREVSKNRKKPVSATHVKNVLNPKKSSWDPAIIAEAQAIILDEKSGIIKVSEILV